MELLTIVMGGRAIERSPRDDVDVESEVILGSAAIASKASIDNVHPL